MLPPTSDSLKHHLQRASYQTYIWRKSLVAKQDLPNSPDRYGWLVQETVLCFKLMSKDPAPATILELNTCRCKKSSCGGNCSCKSNGLACIESCLCMGDGTCKSPSSPFCSSC